MRVSFGVERSGYDKDQTKRSHKFVTRTNIPVEIIANIILDASNTGDGKSIGYDRSSASLLLSPSSCFLRAASTTARVVGSICSVASINSVGDRSLNEFVFVGVVVVVVVEGSGGRTADVGSSSLSVGVTKTLVLECIVVVVVAATSGDDNHECLVWYRNGADTEKASVMVTPVNVNTTTIDTNERIA